MARHNFQVFKDGSAYDSMPVITPLLWEAVQGGSADKTISHDGMVFFFIEFRGAELYYGYHGAVLWQANNAGEKLIRISLCADADEYRAAVIFHTSKEDAEALAAKANMRFNPPAPSAAPAPAPAAPAAPATAPTPADYGTAAERAREAVTRIAREQMNMIYGKWASITPGPGTGGYVEPNKGVLSAMAAGEPDVAPARKPGSSDFGLLPIEGETAPVGIVIPPGGPNVDRKRELVSAIAVDHPSLARFVANMNEFDIPMLEELIGKELILEIKRDKTKFWR